MCSKVPKWLFTTPVGYSLIPHHLDLALEDSVGHSTCMSVSARRRAMMGLGLGLGYHGVVVGFFAPPVWEFRCTRGST